MGSVANTSEQDTRGWRRRLVGRVVNNTDSKGRARKTIVVQVVRRFRDPVYGKYVKRARKYHAHDDKEQYRTNDLVEILESRPCRPQSAGWPPAGRAP